MSSLLAAECGLASADPLQGLPRRPSRPSVRSTFGLAFCACSSALAFSSEATASTSRGNFVQVVENSTPQPNFVVIRSLAKGAQDALSSTAHAMPAERVDFDPARLDAFVATRQLALRPVFLHVSARRGQERQTVWGLRDNEVWRYEIEGATRKVARLGRIVPVTEPLRAEHESAVVDGKMLLAYRPTIDLPNGEAVLEAGAPVRAFVRTSTALFRVKRADGGSFDIAQVGVVESE